MKLGFIGIGNMASAIINGIENKKDIVIATRSNVEQKAQELGVNFVNSNKECAQYADIIFLCVKPQQFETVLAEIKEDIKNKTLVSIAAKLDIDAISKLSDTERIIRVMPNLNVSINEGTSAICFDPSVSYEAIEEVSAIFQNLGDVEEIPESLFSAFIGIAGSAPAFIFEFMEGLIKEALVEGMDYEQALRIATSTMRGSAANLNQSELKVKDLISLVCSPGGTTIEGINALRSDNFQDIIANAVRRTINKDKN